jgi:hypothetical protein
VSDHRNPASRRRRRKGNPVLGNITGPLFPWGMQIRGPGPPGWWSLESETVKCGHEFRETRTWECLPWRGPAATVNDRPILSSERMLRKDYNLKCSVEKNTGHESQGTCRQDELIASRKVTLTLTVSGMSGLENRCVSVLVSCCCEKLVAEARGAVREPRVKGSRYQTTTGEELAPAVVNCRVRELAIAL